MEADYGVLFYLYNKLREAKANRINVYKDLDGSSVGFGTVLPDIMVTTQRPDSAIVNTGTNQTYVVPVERTSPSTTNIQAANDRKRQRYDFLTDDIKERGFGSSNLPLEIGSPFGYINSRNMETFVFLCQYFGIGKFSIVIKNCIKL